MIEAIIFDKDGTLIDFDSLWIPMTANVIGSILKSFGREDIPYEEFLASVGVKNGVTDADGILCKGTYKQITTAFNEVLKRYKCPTIQEQLVIDTYNKCADSGEIKPTCENIREVLIKLKECGIKLAIVTTDNAEITHKCLKKLEIVDLFDKVYTDDGKTPVKPDPYCALDFSDITGVGLDKILMVGDTMTDVYFAKNAGISFVGVAMAPQNRFYLNDCADVVVPDISYIYEFIKEDK